MKVLYATDPDGDGEHRIYYVIPDYQWFWFTHSTNRPLTVLDIPETPPNQELCLDIMKDRLFVDEQGRGKHVIKNGAVQARPGWKRREEPREVGRG